MARIMAGETDWAYIFIAIGILVWVVIIVAGVKLYKAILNYTRPKEVVKIRCAHCGTLIPEGSVFCLKCGSLQSRE